MTEGDVRGERYFWLDRALVLEDEVERLRAAIVSLLAWVAQQRDLRDYAAELIAERWPEAS